MPAYIVALIDIKDPVKYKGYGDGWDFKSFTEDYGGELLMISDEPEVIEGELSGRLVIMKFPDRDKARAWYDSPECPRLRLRPLLPHMRPNWALRSEGGRLASWTRISGYVAGWRRGEGA